jgi:hypothetical protein
MFLCEVYPINTAKSVALSNNVISRYILPMYGEKLLAPMTIPKVLQTDLVSRRSCVFSTNLSPLSQVLLHLRQDGLTWTQLTKRDFSIFVALIIQEIKSLQQLL